MGTKLASAVILIGAAVFVLWMLHVGPFSIPSGVSVAPAGNEQVSEPKHQVAGRPTPALPQGKQVFEVAQSPKTWPKFVQVSVDPLDVRPNQVQKMTAVVQDDVEITSVVAEIRTDHQTKEVPLTLAGATADKDLIPRRHYVDDNGHLAFLDTHNTFVLAAIAKAQGIPSYTYAGQWTVEDTHNATYTTKFIAKDAVGRTNSITLAWSDPNCGAYMSSATYWKSASTLTGNCAIGGSYDDGIDGGNLTINAGVTLTLVAMTGGGGEPTTWIFNPGNSITVNGAIAIGSGNPGAQIMKGWLCAQDYDGDLYADPYGLIEVASDNSDCTQNNFDGGVYKTIYTKRLNTLTGFGDCYDQSVQVNPGQTAYFTTSTGSGGNGFDWNCSTVEEKDVTTYQGNCVKTGVCTDDLNCPWCSPGVDVATPACGVGYNDYYYGDSCVATAWCASASPTCPDEERAWTCTYTHFTVGCH
jgi:hypothetical protein